VFSLTFSHEGKKRAIIMVGVCNAGRKDQDTKMEKEIALQI